MKKTVILIILTVITITCIFYGIYKQNEKFKESIDNSCFNYSFFGFSSNNNKNYKESNLSTNLETFNSIELNAKVMAVTIKQGSTFHLTCNSNRESLIPEYYISNGILYIKQNKSSNNGNNNCELELTIPRFTQFDKVNITTNVGEISLQDFDCQKLEIENHVGQIDISEINFDVLSAKSNVGEINIQTISEIQDYSIDADTNIGVINIENSNSNKKYSHNGNTPKTIKVFTNIGEINIR